jgi:hypothetical protein
MALDETCKEANFRRSVLKYLVDNLKTALSIDVIDDPSIPTPSLVTSGLRKWVRPIYGSMNLDTVTSADLEIHCCTRKDVGSVEAIALRDIVLGLFANTPIPLYNITTWTNIGYMYPIILPSPGNYVEEDSTKADVLAIRLKWGAVI